MEKLLELEHSISIRIMQEDAETIYSLLASERNSIFSMEIIPYYALFVQSCQEFTGEDFLPEPIALQIKDIRNHIKLYAERYTKTKKRVVTIDDAQNEEFKSRVKFAFLRKRNLHFNLGTYWTNDCHIIGNTQQLADYLDIKHFYYGANKKMYELGYQISSFVSSVRDGFAESLGLPEIQRKKKSIAIKHYCDINTNQKNPLFLDGTNKELNLFFLHLLCNMNFVKYVLRELLEDGNTWLLRIEYVVTYYTYRSLERLKNYCENNSDTIIVSKEIEKILKKGEPLFKSKFRNCMMHYDIKDAGVISPQNVEKLFYGIVETCFDGKDYYTYLGDLRELSDEVIAFLEKQFDFSNIDLCEL